MVSKFNWFLVLPFQYRFLVLALGVGLVMNEKFLVGFCDGFCGLRSEWVLCFVTECSSFWFCLFKIGVWCLFFELDW